MKETITRVLGRLLWGLVEGSSIVVFDRKSGRVRKIQQPRIFIRLLNLLAFQKWNTLYEREVGLQIATLRREIARWVLQCGDVRCQVAPCLEIERRGGQFALVTKLVEGRQPVRKEAIPISQEITALFLRAGLSTWPICISNPRFQTNFVIDGEGTPWIVDLESHVPGIFAPSKELWDNLLIGSFPPLDDIHFPKLWRFCREEGEGLLVEDRERFRTVIHECEELTREQKSQEPRVWSRLLGALLRVSKPRKEWDR